MSILTLTPPTREPIESLLASVAVDAFDTGLAETLPGLHITLPMVAAIGIARALDAPNSQVPESDCTLVALSTGHVGLADTLAAVPVAQSFFRSLRVTIAAWKKEEEKTVFKYLIPKADTIEES